MANQWFKFYGGEYLSDPKMGRLSAQERSCWITLLCLASMNGGVIKYLTIEDLLNKSGIQFNVYDTDEWDSMLTVLQTFERYGMCNVSDNGEITITNWEKRQETNLTGAERQKIYRERLKQKESDANVTERVTNVTLEENRIEENRTTGEDKSSRGKKKL